MTSHPSDTQRWAPVDVADLPRVTGEKQRLFGLDLGTKTIGLALSDGLWTVATPFETLKRSKFKKDAEILLSLVEEHGVGALIIGLPVNMDGSEGPRAQATRAFARNFGALCDIPMAFWDERLSTSAVTRTLIEADVSRAKRAEAVDKMAASFILQGALDFLANLAQRP